MIPAPRSGSGSHDYSHILLELQGTWRYDFKTNLLSGFFMRVAILGLLISIPLYAASDFDREQMQQRISPVGKVRVEEPAQASSAAPQVEQVAVKKSPEQAIYEQYCVVCHRDGVAGAPKFRDEADWKPRLAKQNLDSLTATAIKGLNAMPAKGTCQECSEADLKAAIKYMVPQ